MNTICLKTILSKKSKAPAFLAVKESFNTTFTVIKKNETGFIKSTNPEFLHDFRVSIRKIRSLLNQLKNVYNDQLTSEFKNNFKSIGNSTNQLRDLDVFLLNKKKYLSSLKSSSRRNLYPFFKEINNQRQLLYNKLISEISSTKYKDFMDKFQYFLDNNKKTQKGIAANTSIASMASERIQKQYNFILELGKTVTQNSPDTQFHKLRIHYKKLRYLLASFNYIYQENELSEFVDQLKSLQLYLGQYNDYSTQNRYLETYFKSLSNIPSEDKKIKTAIMELMNVLNIEKLNTSLLFFKVFNDFTLNQYIFLS